MHSVSMKVNRIVRAGEPTTGVKQVVEADAQHPSLL